MKVYVIRFSALGDCILLCPFLAHLKENGAHEVTVITKRAYVALFAAARGVDRIIALDDRAGYRGIRQIIDSHRGEDIVVIDAHGSLRSRILSRGLGGASSRIKKYYRERLGLIGFKRPCDIPAVAERYSRLGEALGFPSMSTRVGGIEIPETARRAIDAILDRHEGETVAIAPGSRWPMKRWGVEKYVELTRRILDKTGAQVVLLGDASEAADAAPFLDAFGGAVTNLVGQTGILETAAAIERSAVFIGNDSGLMHLAEAVGVPVIALFGPTVEELGYFPSLPQSKVVERELTCRPCSRNGRRPCPKGTQECLAGIPVERVEDALWDLIDEEGPARYVHA